MVQKPQTGRLAGFEFLRFYFITWICLCHIWTPFQLLHGGAGNGFFFISSGYFLYRGFVKKQLTVYQFARKRFIRLFPVYIIGVILGYFFLFLDLWKDGCILEGESLAESIITESLMLHYLGCFTHLNLGNPVSWFISVLFISSILLYSILRYNCRLTINILIPAFCIGFLTLYAHSGVNHIESLSKAIGPVFLPLGEGLTGLSLGVLIGKISPEITGASRREKTALNILSFIALFLVTSYILFIKGNLDTLAIILLVFVVAACSFPDSWLNCLFNHRIWIFLGGISYEMLMLHIPCRYLINFGYNLFPVYRSLWIIAYLLLTILSAYLLKIGLKRVLPKMER